MSLCKQLPAARAAGNVSGPLLLLSAMLVIIALLSTAPALAGDERLRPIKPIEGESPSIELRIERAEEVQRLVAPLYENRLFRERDESMDRAGRAELVNILVLRLAYRSNRLPELNTIPADGGLMMDAADVPEYALRVDPPPHDTAYFEAHMRALREFYLIQSYGKFDMEWTIAEGPSPADGAFLISDIADYAPPEGESWSLELLETFMRAALDSINTQLLDTPGNTIRFADFDHVIIFHAGSDFQNDVLRNSPNDLPTFNIFFGDPLGPHPVDVDGETLLGSVVLLPETATQDADADHVLGAINAVTAHEFGHQLGLVDTYNTDWGWPSVGYWDLMDSGNQVLYGFERPGEPENLFVIGALPTSFSIWHRMILGWVEEEDGSLLRPGGGSRSVELRACNLQDEGHKAVRIDLTDSEYFILENRQEQLYVGDRFVKQDPDTKVFQFMSFNFPLFPDSALNNGEYDYFIEQAGLLAWHIDERGFPGIYDGNIVNPNHDKHVQLVQADGVGDLGNPYSWSWRGDEYDPFYTGNNTEWTDTTVPSTRLRDGTSSGFSLTDLVTSPYLTETSAVDSIITFDIALQGFPPGFPRDDSELVDSTLVISPAAGTLLPMGTWLGYMMSSLNLDAEEQAHWVRSETLLDTDPDLTPVTPLPRIEGLPLGAFRIPTALSSISYWGVATKDRVDIWEMPGGDEAADPPPEPLATIPLADSLIAGPIVYAAPDTTYLFWVTTPGTLVDGLKLVTSDRSPTVKRLPPRVIERGDRDRAENVKTRLVRIEMEGQQKLVHCYADADTSYATVLDIRNIVDPNVLPPIDLEMPQSSGSTYWIRVMDTDGNDSDEILWIDDSGHVAKLTEGGPVTLFAADLGVGAVTAPPIPADMNGDGLPELIIPAGSHVHRFSMAGHEHLNWPVRLEELVYLEETMRVGSVLRASDIDGDNLSELIFFSQTGHLLIIDDDGEPILGTPRSMAASGPRDIYTPSGKVYAVSKEGYLLCFEGLKGSRLVADWPLDSGGSTRDGTWSRWHAISQVAVFPEAEDWFIYPNPAATTARVYHGATEPGTRAHVEVFDIEGQLCFRKEGISEAGGPWELPLNLTGLAPAVYICKIEIEADGRSVQFIRRLGVVR